METSIQSIHERLAALATSDLLEFRLLIRRLRKVSPEQASEASLWYMGSHGLDVASQSMAIWLSGDHDYISVLLDLESLSPEMASKAIAVVKELDPEFLLKFAKAVDALIAGPLIMRALRLLPAIGDYSLFIPWLRRLGAHSDDRIRSRSSRLLCELRPNKGLIERQMHSGDPRVRASAIEVLWHVNTSDARNQLRAAMTDPHHRVVGNALVGLYLLGETNVIDRMIELSTHKDHLFRSAMAWAMGHIKDVRAVPVLEELKQDRSLVVRKQAINSLQLIPALEIPEIEMPLPVVESPLPETLIPESLPAPTPEEHLPEYSPRFLTL